VDSIFKNKKTKGARLSGGAECPKSPKAQRKDFRVSIWTMRLSSFNPLVLRPTVKHPSLSLREPYSV
jgi:hypothetical protein